MTNHDHNATRLFTLSSYESGYLAHKRKPGLVYALISQISTSDLEENKLRTNTKKNKEHWIKIFAYFFRQSTNPDVNKCQRPCFFKSCDCLDLAIII